MMVLLDLEDGLYEVGQEEREEPRYYPAPWDPRVLLPSVTTILGVLRNPFLQRWRGKLGNEEADRVTKSTSQYGQMVHDYTAIGDMVGGGMEVIGNVDPSMQLQLERYFKWRVEHIAEVVEVEMVVYSRKWLYAGRLDRVFLFKGDSSCSLWDIKTGTVRGISRAQTAAYVVGYQELLGAVVGRRGIINISRKTGKVGIKEHSSDISGDFEAFRKLREIYDWLESVGEV